MWNHTDDARVPAVRGRVLEREATRREVEAGLMDAADAERRSGTPASEGTEADDTQGEG